MISSHCLAQSCDKSITRFYCTIISHDLSQCFSTFMPACCWHGIHATDATYTLLPLSKGACFLLPQQLVVNNNCSSKLLLAGTCSCCSALLFLLKGTMADASNDSLSGDNDIEIYTPDEMLRMGLKLLKWEDNQLARVCRETQVTRCIGHFAANPRVYAQMWEDLQTTFSKVARICQTTNLGWSWSSSRRGVM